MSLSSTVLAYKQRFPVREPYFSDLPNSDLSLIIAIPAFKEPDLAGTLRSLAKCQTPKGTVEIIVTINAPEAASREVLQLNQATFEAASQWEKEEMPEFLKLKIIREEALPNKHAGAGLARKIGMDEAVQRWAMLETDGPIVCLDADCTVSENYLVVLEKAFADPKTRVGHLHFEHLFEQEADLVLKAGIIHYELHLRYYIEGLKKAGYPFAVHTVGSCMAVRASAYAKAGGMNRRKAGEDFYFIHKLVPLGGWITVSEATVFPSCRVSDRVPFGTGKAQADWKADPSQYLSYHPELYGLFKRVFDQVESWHSQQADFSVFPEVVQRFFADQNGHEKIKEMQRQSTTAENFQKRFWQWMDGFLVLKFTHFLRDNGYPNQPLTIVASQLLAIDKEVSAESLLKRYRQISD